jgi:hypothetical protein
VVARCSEYTCMDETGDHGGPPLQLNPIAFFTPPVLSELPVHKPKSAATMLWVRGRVREQECEDKSSISEVQRIFQTYIFPDST